MLNQGERRKAVRFSVRLKVYDQGSSKLIGYCEDISLNGIRLMSETPLPTNMEVNVSLDRNDNGTGISLTLYRVWQAVSETVPRYYYTGLHIVSPDDQTLDSIQDLIHDLFVSQ